MIKIYRYITIIGIAIAIVGCITPPPTGAAGTAEIVIIRLRLPKSLQLFAQQLFAILPRDSHIMRTDIYAISDTEIALDFKIANLKESAKINRFLPILTIDTHTEYEIYRARFAPQDLERLLHIPNQFIPPINAQLNREETIEYYRWILSAYVDPSHVESLLRSISISLIVEPGRRSTQTTADNTQNTLSDTINMLDFLVKNRQLSVEYRKQIP